MEGFSFRYVKPQALIVCVVLLGSLLFAANKFLGEHWSVSFSVFGFIGGLFALINSYLWHIKPFSYLYSIPDFRGRYEGEIKYEFKNENCEIIKGTLKHVKVIHQNGSNIVVNSFTKKEDGSSSSNSLSIDASIVKEKDGTFKLIYNYLNDGNADLGFPPHYGTEILKHIVDKKKKSLVGRYYTERLPFMTKGKIELEYKNNNLKHDK